MSNATDLGIEKSATVGEYNVSTMLSLAAEIDHEDFENHAGCLRNFEPWIRLRMLLFEVSLRLNKSSENAEAAEAEVTNLREQVATLTAEANKYRMFWQASQQELAALAGAANPRQDAL